MKIAVLSGADKNAGDFLIVHRSKELLRKFFPGCELIDFARNRPLQPRLEELNQCSLVVFAGGPGYVPDMYPGRFPLVANLDDIIPPIMVLGMGGYTPTRDASNIKFNERSRELLSRIERDGFGLGCRDLITAELLRSNGYDSAVFTGCPAWYDLSKVAETGLLMKPNLGQVKTIAISDPAKRGNLDAVKHLVSALEEAFPDASMKIVFHRGWRADGHSRGALAKRQTKLVSWAEGHGIPSVDISYGWEGFHEYDSCDLHVGYRVHAHLYNMSQRKPSFLIEEDGRGYGANDALGRKTHVGIKRNPGYARKFSAGLSRIGVDWCPFNASHASTAESMVAYVMNEAAGGYPDNEASCRAANMAFNAMKNQLDSAFSRLESGC